MAKTTVSPIVSLALAVLLSAACDVFSSEPVEVLVSVDPRQFIVGDSSKITVTAVNRSWHRFRVSGCEMGYQVFDSAGNFVAPLWICVDDRLYPPHLERRGTLVETYTWRGETFKADARWLPPGVYRVYGVLDAAEVRAISSPVTVELL